MSSESGQRLPMEELKRRNAPQPIPTQACPSKEEWQELLHRLDELERQAREAAAQAEEAAPGEGGAEITEIHGGPQEHDSEES